MGESPQRLVLGPGGTTPVVDPSEPASGEAASVPGPVWGWRRRDWATWAFAAYLVLAFFFSLQAGSHYWFHADEWRLIGPTEWTVDDYFQPQNGHWSTIPVLFYRVWYELFGLHSYLVYQVPLVLMHLTLAVLLRVTMRRSGVSPWVATLVAASFVLLGTAEQNILSPIQVSMVGSLLFGYAQLLLIDRDGPVGRRDVVGVLFGVLALMASGIGMVMVVVAAAAALLRRGWLAAAVHGGVPTLVYCVWLWWHREGSVEDTTGGLQDALPWLADGVSGVYLALGHVGALAIVLAMVTVVGLVLAWRGLPLPDWRRQAAGPAALLVGLVAFFVLVGYSRGGLPAASARSSRYIGIGAALVLPAVAVAINAIAARWRLGWLALVPLVVAIPFEAARLGDLPLPRDSASIRVTLLTAAYSPCLDDARAGLQVDPSFYRASGATVAFLRDARERGLLPPPPDDVSTYAHVRVAEILGCDIEDHIEGFPTSDPGS